MQIRFVEISNFRKLKSVRIDFSEETTLFVGANNSGKTSAMVALRRFLVDHGKFTPNDFTLSNWLTINAIGTEWEQPQNDAQSAKPDISKWNGILPAMDVWMEVAPEEIHYVSHILPSLEWTGGALGVRLQLEPHDLDELFAGYSVARKAAITTIKAAAKKRSGEEKYEVPLWPASMIEFLERGLNGKLVVKAYVLDPSRLKNPEKGIAQPQSLPPDSQPVEGNPFRGLIRIDEINAQRGFADATANHNQPDDGTETPKQPGPQILSTQLRTYYSRHIDPADLPDVDDVDALEAIYQAQKKFDGKLKSGFAPAFEEVQALGYPGVSDPRLTISTKIRPTDGLEHPSALQYEVVMPGASPAVAPRLPEQFNGLGYQNLISMVFRLMSFRDDWMQVGKVGKRAASKFKEESTIPPLHLVLIEEPEVHLHVQVQQVFIRKAYSTLRKHSDLGAKTTLKTQLVISTHSGHIAHECQFASLRYFRRIPAVEAGNVPTSTVINLSKVFGTQDATQKFVTRYLQATHCDLFFADAAILVEGPAERILVPHFVRNSFAYLDACYITILEIGGSHAHRLRGLVEELGLVTLVITDLDPAQPPKNTSTIPKRGADQVSRNATLKTWVPEAKEIDKLLDLPEPQKVKQYDELFSVRVAYQCPKTVKLEGDTSEEALPYTFEDSLVFENIELFKQLKDEAGLLNSVNEAVTTLKDASSLGAKMYDLLQKGSKASFALDMLYLSDPKQLAPPNYIKEGLTWLQTQMQSKLQDSLQLPVSQTPATSPAVAVSLPTQPSIGK